MPEPAQLRDAAASPRASPTRRGQGRAPRTMPPTGRGAGDPNRRGSHRGGSSRNEGRGLSGGSYPAPLLLVSAQHVNSWLIYQHIVDYSTRGIIAVTSVQHRKCLFAGCSFEPEPPFSAARIPPLVSFILK